MAYKSNFSFIKRTKKLLGEYETRKDKINPKKYYDVTLLFNACVGLLFVAHEKGCIPNILLKNADTSVWGLQNANIKKCAGKKTLKNIGRHLRNSIAHYLFYPSPSNGEIKEIKFIDENPRNNDPTFEMTVSVEEFRKFVLKVADEVIKGVKSQPHPSSHS